MAANPVPLCHGLADQFDAMRWPTVFFQADVDVGRIVVGLHRVGGAGAGGYSNTPEGKIIIAAFADSYNQLIKAVRNYRAQTVKGGLGTGGALGVQGGTTPSAPRN